MDTISAVSGTIAINFATMASDSLKVTVQAEVPEQPGKVLPPAVCHPAKRDLLPALAGVAVSSTSVSASRILLFVLAHGSAQAKSLSEEPATFTVMPPLPVPVAELSICARGINTTSTSLISPSVTVQVFAAPVHFPFPAQ